MWYAVGGGVALLYLILIFTLGLTTLRKGHWVMFVLGIFVPLFWLVNMPTSVPAYSHAGLAGWTMIARMGASGS